MERPELAALREDELFWNYVENGAIEQALNRGSALKLSFDPGLRGELAELGIVDAGTAADANAFRKELRSVLGEVGPRIKTLKQSGELDRLLKDPAVFRAVQNGDTVTLFSNPEFRKLVYRVLDSQPATPGAAEPPAGLR
jgi:hypothetical protein